MYFYTNCELQAVYTSTLQLKDLNSEHRWEKMRGRNAKSILPATDCMARMVGEQQVKQITLHLEILRDRWADMLV